MREVSPGNGVCGIVTGSADEVVSNAVVKRRAVQRCDGMTAAAAKRDKLPGSFTTAPAFGCIAALNTETYVWHQAEAALI